MLTKKRNSRDGCVRKGSRAFAVFAKRRLRARESHLALASPSARCVMCRRLLPQLYSNNTVRAVHAGNRVKSTWAVDREGGKEKKASAACASRKARSWAPAGRVGRYGGGRREARMTLESVCFDQRLTSYILSPHPRPSFSSPSGSLPLPFLCFRSVFLLRCLLLLLRRRRRL
jgi:hypothetical protein